MVQAGWRGELLQRLRREACPAQEEWPIMRDVPTCGSEGGKDANTCLERDQG